ncbi:MAG: D-glycero-beta-D-manno-heptose-7-phosphate kinase [Candidatus Woesearchaeota archaeon]
MNKKMDALNLYLNRFNEKNILIIGDIMLDKYIFGKVERISPEAPVPIIKIEKEKYSLGGAANTANNIASLSGNAFLFGVVGDDKEKDILLELLKLKKINSNLFIDSKKKTIQKIRVVSQNQQLIRIDYEDDNYIEKKFHKKIIEKIKEINNFDAIIISDYAKGTITKELTKELITYATNKKIPILVDPKPKHKSFYKGCTLITPNKKESEEMVNFKIDNQKKIKKAGKKLVNDLKCNVVITLGENGMHLFEKNNNDFYIPTMAKEVYDVSGAGDTVIATLALSLCSGASLKESVILANYAAGIKVGKFGTSPVLLEELQKIIENRQ